MHKYDTFKVYNLPLISFQTNTNITIKFMTYNKIYSPNIHLEVMCCSIHHLALLLPNSVSQCVRSIISVVRTTGSKR